MNEKYTLGELLDAHLAAPQEVAGPCTHDTPWGQPRSVRQLPWAGCNMETSLLGNMSARPSFSRVRDVSALLSQGASACPHRLLKTIRVKHNSVLQASGFIATLRRIKSGQQTCLREYRVEVARARRQVIGQ